MAQRFDWVPIPVSAAPAAIVQNLNRMAQRLSMVLAGVRRERESLLSSIDLGVDRNGGGLIVTTPDGTKRYRISVDNTGAVTTTLL